MSEKKIPALPKSQSLPGHAVLFGGGSKERVGGQVQVSRDAHGGTIDQNGNYASVRNGVKDSTYMNLGYGGKYGGLGVLAIGNDAVIPKATLKVPQTNTSLSYEQYLAGSQGAMAGDAFAFKANPRVSLSQGLGNLKLKAQMDLGTEHPDAAKMRLLNARYKMGNGSVGATIMQRGDESPSYGVQANYRF